MIDEPSHANEAIGNPHDLRKPELYWRDHYHWLLDYGYQLRQRFHPEWVPSWKTNSKLREGLTEDSQVAHRSPLMDATRVKDDSQVMLKRLRRDGSDEPEEVEIMRYFSDGDVASSEENHCIPLLACLEPPDDKAYVIIVMPVLRPYHDPDFETVGEGLDFIRQVLEGFTFLHQHRVAHRDIRTENIMMDGTGIYTEKWFPWEVDRKLDYTGRVSPRFTKTERPPKYYIIDYGFSKQYPPDEMPPSELPKLATDQTVPEFQGLRANEPCDPFPVDVYTLGNLIRTDFMDGNPDNKRQNGRLGFEFLRPLVTSMTMAEPSERITMADSVAKLEEIIEGLSTSTLRSRAIRIPGRFVEKANIAQHVYQTTVYWSRRFSYVVRRLPPVPARKRTSLQVSDTA